jgi:hypothetical protein
MTWRDGRWHFSTYIKIGRDAAKDAVSDVIESTHKMPDDDDAHDKVTEMIYDTIAMTQRTECELITQQLVAAVHEKKLTDFIRWLYIRGRKDIEPDPKALPIPRITEEDIATAMKVEIFK